MARKMFEKGLVEAGGGPGGGGAGRPGFRSGDLGLKGLRPPRGARAAEASKVTKPYPSTAEARGEYMRGQAEEAGQQAVGSSTPVKPNTSRSDYLKGLADRSVEEAGGYPTRGGQPLMTKMQQRMETRKAAAEANPPPPSAGAKERAMGAAMESYRTAGRQAPLKKMFGVDEYRKGGMVKGQCRDYSK